MLNFFKFNKKCFTSHPQRLSHIKEYVKNTKDVRLSTYITDPDNRNSKYLVFLHGLFGNSNNWRTIAYSDPIREKINCILVDMRNHGESDHHDSMTYHEMADDVARTLDLKGINKCTLLGHSMGAKVAMTFAINYPDRLNGLIVVDSAPIDNRDKSYIYSNTKDIIDKVYDYNIDNKSRKEVVEDFKKMFRGPTANLLNTNLTYVDSKSDKIKWRINLKAIKDNIDNILGFEYKKGKFYKGPIKVLVGEKSFIFDIEDYKKIFPDIKEEDFAIIKNAGHWLHSDQPAQTIKEISSFLDKIDTKDLYNL